MGCKTGNFHLPTVTSLIADRRMRTRGTRNARRHSTVKNCEFHKETQKGNLGSNLSACELFLVSVPGSQDETLCRERVVQ